MYMYTYIYIHICICYMYKAWGGRDRGGEREASRRDVLPPAEALQRPMIAII